MRINFWGQPVDEPEIKAGFIGCGSHSFRNLYPVFQFTPVNLTAICDLNIQKAKLFADQFGAKSTYADHKQMLKREKPDAVFICTNYDEKGRPLYPRLALDCLEAGCHVWIEKPPAASCSEIEQMQKVAAAQHKNVVVGMKKMFFPANEKAHELMKREEFGTPQLVILQYPQYIPTPEEFQDYLQKGIFNNVVGFLDHLCHPASLMIFLLGMPTSLYYKRSPEGAGIAIFQFGTGTIASLAFTQGASLNCGMERTVIISNKGSHIIVENNIRVALHRMPFPGYGNVPDYFTAGSQQVSAVWEPEFSLGQLYNKGLFLLGYYNEINEFARSILENRAPVKGTLEQAWQVTRLFEAFAEGANKEISLTCSTTDKESRI